MTRYGNPDFPVTLKMRIPNSAIKLTRYIVLRGLTPLIFLGCTSNFKQPQDPNSQYQMDLCMVANGVSGCGIVSVPYPADNRLKIYVRAPRGFDMDEVTYRYCERHIRHEKEGSRDLIKDTLDPDLHRLQCDYEIRAIDTEKANSSEGLVMIQTLTNKLRADIRCNGDWYAGILGDGGCHAAKGLINHLIKFRGQVECRGSGCEMFRTDDKILWTYTVPAKRTEVFFYDLHGETFRFLVKPYDDSLLRRY